MKRLIILGTACSVSFGAGAASPILLRAEGEFSSFLGRLEYDPSRACNKPMRPFSKDRWAWENYAQEGKRYLGCIKDAADSDVGYAQRVIQAGYSEAADEFLQEVRRGY